MGNNIPNIAPETEVNTASNSSISTTELKDSVNTVTHVTITTSSLFLLLLAIIVLVAIGAWSLNKDNLSFLNSRIGTLARLTGFGSQHLNQDIELQSIPRRDSKRNNPN